MSLCAGNRGSILHKQAENHSSGGHTGEVEQVRAGKYANIIVERIMEVAAQTAEAGSWNVPTQLLIEQLITDTVTIAELRNRPEMRYMPKNTVREWLSITEKERNSDGLTAEMAGTSMQGVVDVPAGNQVCVTRLIRAIRM